VQLQNVAQVVTDDVKENGRTKREEKAIFKFSFFVFGFLLPPKFSACWFVDPPFGGFVNRYLTNADYVLYFMSLISGLIETL